MIPEAGLVAALKRKGFDVARRRGNTVRLARRRDHRHDHVRLDLAAAAWWRRRLGRPGKVVDVVAGVVWPIGEQAFSRPVPPVPVVPQQAHAATGFESLCADSIDPATVAAAVDDWFRRLEDPAVALEVGAIADPLRRLEFAVVTSRREAGLEAAAVAREAAAHLPPARREQALARIERAESRLPRA